MVCIAAFIILAIIGVFVAGISIFKPKVGKAYLKALKKAWGCLWKKVRLQKCETGFKEDVKNTLLSRVMLKHPKMLKPLSIIIEVLSVIIVVVTVWAILVAIKSLLALWALGSCNVTKPSACSLGAEMCSIDEDEPTNILEATGRWFTEWGEIFEAIPDKFKTYKAEDYDFVMVSINPESDKPVAVDIFDPGCSVCMASYRNQKEAGFFENYSVKLVPFAIQNSDNEYKFENSEIIVKYMLAAEEVKEGAAIKIIDKIFTQRNSKNIAYFNMFDSDYTNGEVKGYSHDEAIMKLEEWLKAFEFSDSEMKKVQKYVAGETIKDDLTVESMMTKNREIVENQLRVKGIPTIIFDGKRHTGLWKNE